MMKNRKEYDAWAHMKTRCYNKDYPLYHRYGGRGITVCERWINSFQKFLKDMGLKPEGKYSLERKNNDLGYSPENCKWATGIEQNNNRNNNIILEYLGEKKPLSFFAEKYNMTYAKLYLRIYRYGLSIEQALTWEYKNNVWKPKV